MTFSLHAAFWLAVLANVVGALIVLAGIRFHDRVLGRAEWLHP